MNNTIMPSTPFEKEVVEVLNLMVRHAESVQRRFAHLEGHVGEIGKRSNQIIVRMPKKHRLLIFAAGVGVGIYLANKSNGWLEFEKVQTDAPNQPADYTVKTNPNPDV
jgi:hypothetical protein